MATNDTTHDERTRVRSSVGNETLDEWTVRMGGITTEEKMVAMDDLTFALIYKLDTDLRLRHGDALRERAEQMLARPDLTAEQAAHVQALTDELTDAMTRLAAMALVYRATRETLYGEDILGADD